MGLQLRAALALVQVIGDVVLKVREDAFDAVLKRDLSFYDTIPSGKIVSRVTSDTQAFSNVVTLTLDLMSQMLLVVLLLSYLFLIDVRLTLMTLALAPLIVVTALSFRRIARKTVTHHGACARWSARTFRRRSAGSASPRRSARSAPSTTSSST